MATLTIRRLDDEVKTRLRVRAADHGRSMEEEARTILADSVAEQQTSGDLGSRIHARFAALGGADLDLPLRTDLPQAANLDS